MRAFQAVLAILAITLPALFLSARRESPPRLPVSMTGLFDLQNERVVWKPQEQASATVIVFTAHECPVANRSVPDLNRLWEEFAEKGIEFLFLYTDPEAPAELVQTHVKEYAIGPPVLIDRDHVFVRKLGAKMTPEVFVFDAEGKAVYRGRINDRFSGFGQSRPAPTRHDLRDALEALVAGKDTAYREAKGFGCTLLVQPPETE